MSPWTLDLAIHNSSFQTCNSGPLFTDHVTMDVRPGNTHLFFTNLQQWTSIYRPCHPGRKTWQYTHATVDLYLQTMSPWTLDLAIHTSFFQTCNSGLLFTDHVPVDVRPGNAHLFFTNPQQWTSIYRSCHPGR